MRIFIALGIAAWMIALLFSLFPTVNVRQHPVGTNVPVFGTASNVVGGLTSAGFAVSGGLCFLGAALVTRARQHQREKLPDHLAEAFENMGQAAPEKE